MIYAANSSRRWVAPCASSTPWKIVARMVRTEFPSEHLIITNWTLQTLPRLHTGAEYKNTKSFYFSAKFPYIFKTKGSYEITLLSLTPPIFVRRPIGSPYCLSVGPPFKFLGVRDRHVVRLSLPSFIVARQRTACVTLCGPLIFYFCGVRMVWKDSWLLVLHGSSFLFIYLLYFWAILLCCRCLGYAMSNGRMTYCKWFGGKHMAESRYDPHIFLEGLKKTTKDLVVAGVPAEIRIEHPLNVGVKR
jgi:hypothetical protein